MTAFSNRATKDSGDPWFGNVPVDWEITRLKFVGRATIGLTYSPNDLTSDDTGTVVLRSTNIQKRQIDLSDVVRVQMEIPSRLRTRSGDILICSRNGSQSLVGKSAWISESEEGQSFGAFTTVFRSPHNRYLFHLFNSGWITSQAGAYQTSTIFQLTTGVLNEFTIALPSENEQRAISAFLDRKTAQIDAVVAKKQRLIERLQEKRQALISHAVTKGLDPHAPMKDSGIEWLGEVPAHWNLKPLGSIVNIFGGSTPSKNNENYWTGGNIPWVSPKDMKRWEIDDSEDHITKDALVESGISLIRPPAILLVVRGMILARDVPVSITTVPVTINQDMKALVARPGCSAEFLGLLLRAVREAFFALIEESGHGTRCLRTELWRKLPLPIPPIEDQKAICAFVHSEVERATGIERRLVDQITKLQEYRQTLISAAVTGKIDVTQEAGS